MADEQLTTVETREVAPIREPDQLMGALVQAAMNPDVDPDKMERMLAMYERMEARKANEAFNQSFVAAKAKIKPLVRNKRNDQTSSNYVDLEAVADAIDPILTEFGFAPTFGTAPSKLEGHYCMVCDLLHSAGHEKRYEADIPIDAAGMKGTKNKTDTHAFGSTMTYGRRYMKLMIFDIATKDNDGNRPTAPEETIGPEQMTEIDNLLKVTKSDRAKFFEHIKVDGMADITVKQFPAVKKLLERKLKEVSQ